MKATIQFVDGPMDGTVTVDLSKPPQGDPLKIFAWSFYQITGGEIGKASMGASPAAINALATQGAEAVKESGAKTHKYRVIDRREEKDGVFVKAEYFS